MQAEIITIGDELVIGQVIDSNSSFISSRLNESGIKVSRIISIPDQAERIIESLELIQQDTQVVIATGGLGPTSDDRTREALCSFFNTTMTFNQNVYDHIEKLLFKKRAPMNQSNRLQSYVPANAKVLHNELGTAPGLWFDKNRIVYIFLPGVPFEMNALIDQKVIPALKKRFGLSPVLHLTAITQGAFEAQLSGLLREFEEILPPDICLAYLPSPGIIKLRLSCYQPKHETVDEMKRLLELMKTIIPDYYVTSEFKSLEEYVGHLMKTKGLTVSVAESCTGGLVSSLFTSIPGCSSYFKGSVIAYSNEMKRKWLAVKDETLKDFGAVSRETVLEMAYGGNEAMKTDYCIAISGIAGPDGGTHEKPVGTIWIAIASSHKTVSKLFHFGDNRQRNMMRASYSAINMLRKMIEDEE
jgi:nicotinamide-nucleotide amidase